MTSIGIRELRQQASHYVALAKAGERVEVTDRGRLVAYLVPVESDGSALDRLEAAGQYRPPAGHVSELGDPPPVPHGRRGLTDVLADMRDEEAW